MADGGSNLIVSVKSVSPMALAAMTGSVPDLIKCLDAGTKVDEKDSNGWTALHFAAAQGHTGVVSFLLSQGADPLAETVTGSSAKEIAMRAGHIDAMVLLDKAEETGQVILPKDMPDHIRDLKKQVLQLTEMFNDLAARLPDPLNRDALAPKTSSLIMPSSAPKVTL